LRPGRRGLGRGAPFENGAACRFPARRAASSSFSSRSRSSRSRSRSRSDRSSSCRRRSFSCRSRSISRSRSRPPAAARQCHATATEARKHISARGSTTQCVAVR
jgi:hypothetical protein